MIPDNLLDLVFIYADNKHCYDKDALIAEYSYDCYTKKFPELPIPKGLIKHRFKDHKLYCLIKTVDDTYYVLISSLDNIVTVQPVNVETKVTVDGNNYTILDPEFKELF